MEDKMICRTPDASAPRCKTIVVKVLKEDESDLTSHGKRCFEVHHKFRSLTQ